MRKQQNIDETMMAVNPFSYSLRVNVTELTEVIIRKELFSTAQTKETRITNIEYDSYTKIYYHAGIKDMIYKLSPQAKSVYLFILYNLDSGKDWIQLNRQWYMTKNEVKSINTFKEAIKELCRYCFILQNVDYNDVYWINSQLFFQGNRITKYTNNIVVKNKTKI